MPKPVATIGHTHVCPRIEPGPRPHVGGPIVSGRSSVRINGVPVATVGDDTLCTGMPGIDPIAKGSAIVSIDGRKVARQGDRTSHGGRIVTGVPNVRMD